MNSSSEWRYIKIGVDRIRRINPNMFRVRIMLNGYQARRYAFLMPHIESRMAVQSSIDFGHGMIALDQLYSAYEEAYDVLSHKNLLAMSYEEMEASFMAYPKHQSYKNKVLSRLE